MVGKWERVHTELSELHCNEIKCQMSMCACASVVNIMGNLLTTLRKREGEKVRGQFKHAQLRFITE